MIVVGPVGVSRSDMNGFGFFSNAVYDDDTRALLGCVSYSNYWMGQTDEMAFKLSRAFSGMLGGFITLATFICMLVQCFNKHGKSCLWSFMKWCYLISFLCQGASFAILSTSLCESFEGNETECHFGSDGGIAIANAVLLFGMVIATFNSSPPRNPVFRCWHAIDDSSETDESEEEQDDPENPDKKLKKSSRRLNSDDNDNVSLFSNRTGRSNGPRLTVREHAQRLERKSIWPMNEFLTRALTPVSAGAGTNAKTLDTTDKKTWQPPEDPRISAYYRNQRSIFKRFENKKKTPDSVTAASSSSHEDSTIESKKQDSVDSIPNPAVPERTEPVDHTASVTTTPSVSPSPFDQPLQVPPPSRTSSQQRASTPVETGNVIETQGSYLKRVQKGQAGYISEEDEDDDISSNKSGSFGSRIRFFGSTKNSVDKNSVKSGSVKSSSVKSGSVKSSSNKSGRSTKSGSKSSASSEENGSRRSVSTADHPLLDRLRKSVLLGKNGTRIHESRIGNTMKIVDEYPAPGKQVIERMEGQTGIVKVRTEYTPDGRKTVMEETFPDGSRTVTTLIDPMTIED